MKFLKLKKKLFISLSLLCLITLSACSGSHKDDPQPVEKGKHQLAISFQDSNSEELHIGSVLKGQSITETFVIKNISNYTIRNLKTDTVLSDPFKIVGTHEPWLGGTCGASLKPNEGCEISVSFSPTLDSKFPLGITATLIKFTFMNSSNQNVSDTLSLTGKILSPGSLTLKGKTASESYIQISPILAGTDYEETITLHNGGEANLEITTGSLSKIPEFQFKGGAFPGTGGTCKGSLKPGQDCTVVLELVSKKPNACKGEVSIHYFDGAQPQEIVIHLSGNVVSPGVLKLKNYAQPIFQLAPLLPGSVHEEILTLQNTGKSKIVMISETLSVGPEFQYQGGTFPGSRGTCALKKSLKPNQDCTIHLVVVPNKKGPFNSELVLGYFDGTQNQKITIQLKGEGLDHTFTASELLEQQKKHLHVVGTSNLGNTCFANSTHKLLSVHPEILNLFSSTPPAPLTSLQEEVKQKFHTFFVNLTERMKNLESGVFSFIHNNSFSNDLHDVFDSFQSYVNTKSYNPFAGTLKIDQIDAPDYLNEILDTHDYCSVFNCFKELTLSTAKDKSITNLSSFNGPRMLYLRLNVLGSDEKTPITSLRDALAAHLNFRPESNIEFELPAYPGVVVKKDGERSPIFAYDASKKEVPRQLIVVLTRFNAVYDKTTFKLIEKKKLSHTVDIPEVLEIPAYPSTVTAADLDSKSVKPTLIKMHLAAAVVQSGSLNSGHYMAYTYSEKMKGWFLHNDSQVKFYSGPNSYKQISDPANKDPEAPQKDYRINQAAYILLYNVSTTR